jgi:hypothetical protein
MAIVNNTVSEIGDILVIEVDTPILGIVLLSDFIDEVLNETGNKYFEKQFRYSLDGVNYSEWLSLTTDNIRGIEIVPTHTFKVQYTYKRVGSDGTGNLAFNFVTLNGQYIEVESGQIFNKSIFGRFFSTISIDVLNWMLNVLEKMYQPGIIPKYVIRNRNANDLWEDKDYLDFWKLITWFFAIIVTYARLFKNFDTNEILFREYLKAHDLFTSSGSSLEDLTYLLNNLYSQIRERGTNLIAIKKDEILDIDESDEESSSSDADIQRVDGELLRLINSNSLDEFIFCLCEPWKIGWNIDNSSPLYKGTNQMSNLIKSYEKSEGIVNINKYPIINNQFCSIIIENEGEDSDSNEENFNDSEKNGVLKISSVLDNEISGIGFEGIIDLSEESEESSIIEPIFTYYLNEDFSNWDGNLPVGFNLYPDFIPEGSFIENLSNALHFYIDSQYGVAMYNIFSIPRTINNIKISYDIINFNNIGSNNAFFYISFWRYYVDPNGISVINPPNEIGHNECELDITSMNDRVSDDIYLLIQGRGDLLVDNLKVYIES